MKNASKGQKDAFMFSKGIAHALVCFLINLCWL
jgi:hypothetical protein